MKRKVFYNILLQIYIIASFKLNDSFYPLFSSKNQIVLKKMLKLNDRKFIINERKRCYSVFTCFQQVKVFTNLSWLPWRKKATAGFKIGLEKYFGERLTRNKRELTSAWKRARSFHTIPNPRTCRRNSLTWTILIFGTCHPVLSMIIWGIGLLTCSHSSLSSSNGKQRTRKSCYKLLTLGKLHWQIDRIK